MRVCVCTTKHYAWSIVYGRGSGGGGGEGNFVDFFESGSIDRSPQSNHEPDWQPTVYTYSTTDCNITAY